MEIERRFVLDALPFDVSEYPADTILQGYTADGVRYRKIASCTACRYIRTRKKGEGLIREEREQDISADEFAAVWPETAGRRLEKVRRYIPLGSLTAELDEFSGSLSGHFIVEVEFPDTQTADAFVPPEWFRTGAVLREVTDLKQYNNSRLAVHGWPEESAHE